MSKYLTLHHYWFWKISRNLSAIDLEEIIGKTGAEIVNAVSMRYMAFKGLEPFEIMETANSTEEEEYFRLKPELRHLMPALNQKLEADHDKRSDMERQLSLQQQKMQIEEDKIDELKTRAKDLAGHIGELEEGLDKMFEEAFHIFLSSKDNILDR